MHLEAEIKLIPEMHLEAVIERIWRSTWRPRCCHWEMHLEATIERVWRWIWRLRSSNSEILLEAEIKLNCKMHLEALIERVWRWIRRPRSSNSEIHLEAEMQLNSKMHFEVVIKRVCRCTWRPSLIRIGGVLGGSRSGGGRSGGRCDGSWDSLHWLTRDRGDVESWTQNGPPRDESWPGTGRMSIRGWFSTWCVQYFVYAVLGVNSWSLHREIHRDYSTSCSQVMVEREREIRGDGGNHHEKLGLKRIVCESQFTIPDTTGTTPDPVGKNTNTRSSQPIEASCTSDFFYPHVFSILFPSSSPIPPFLPLSQNTKSSHPSLSLHAMIMS